MNSLRTDLEWFTNEILQEMINELAKRAQVKDRLKWQWKLEEVCAIHSYLIRILEQHQ